MRYANPNFIQALINRMEKVIYGDAKKDVYFDGKKLDDIYLAPFTEEKAAKVMKEYDQAEKEYDDSRRLDEYIEELDDTYSAEHAKEDEIANLLAWIKQNEIDQKAHGAVVLDGDHVYPLPVELF